MTTVQTKIHNKARKYFNTIEVAQIRYYIAELLE